MPTRRCEHCGTSFTSTATRCPGCGAYAPEFRASPREDREVDTVVDRFITAQERPESTGGAGSHPAGRTRAVEPIPVLPPPMVRPPQPQPPPEEVPTVITPALTAAEIKRLKEEFAPEMQNFDGEQTQPIVIAPTAPSAEVPRRSSLSSVVLGVLAGLVVAAAGVAALLRFGVLDLTSPSAELPQVPPRVSARPAPAPQELPDWEPEVATTTAAESLETVGPVQPPPQPVAPQTVVAKAPARKPPARRRLQPPPRQAAATASVEPASPPPQPVQPGDLAVLGEAGVVPPRLIGDVQPRFPVRARMSGVSGRVELRLLVDHRGLVENVTVEESSGYAHLDNSAILAARKSRYAPATKEGVPVRMWISRSYNFR